MWTHVRRPSIVTLCSASKGISPEWESMFEHALEKVKQSGANLFFWDWLAGKIVQT